MTLNIKREKSLPITAAVFQRGQVLLSKKAGKGFSVKKKKIMTLAIDILPDLLCDTGKEFRGPQGFSVGGKKVGGRGGGASKALVWLTVKVSVQ